MKPAAIHRPLAQKSFLFRWPAKRHEGDMNHDEFDDGRCGMSRRCWRNLTRICIGLIAIYLLVSLFVMEALHD